MGGEHHFKPGPKSHRTGATNLRRHNEAQLRRYRDVTATLRLGNRLTIRHIVVVKTSSVSFFRTALQEVATMFPRSDISVWTEEREHDEFYGRSDLAGVVLYRNIPSIPRTIGELRALQCDLVVTQETEESDYVKMHFLAATILRRPMLKFYGTGAISGADNWQTSAAKTVYFAWTHYNGPWQLIVGVGRTALSTITGLGRLVAAPFVLVSLLVRATHHEIGRQSKTR